MTWLQAIADEDGLEVEQAAAILVENGVQVTAQDWVALGTKERATLTAARRQALAARLEFDGRDLDAAHVEADHDGGVRAARLMAQSACEGAAEALRRARGVR